MSARVRAALVTVGLLLFGGFLVTLWLSHWAFQGEWRIVRIEGARSTASGTLRFDDRQGSRKSSPRKDLGIKTRCGAYGIAYRRDFGRIRFSEPRNLGDPCPEDGPLLGVLRAATRYRYEGRSLVLAAPDGRRLWLARAE